MNINHVLLIAKNVRRVCEEAAFSKSSKCYDFYHDDGLSCMCAIASVALSECLNYFNCKSKVFEGKYKRYNNHCWVEYRNNIIDITATQFCGISDKVYLIDKHIDSYSHKKYRKSYNDFFYWPNSQRPNKQIIDNIVSKSLKILKQRKSLCRFVKIAKE
jgi:hypothetical protein